jgi:hypothetical protein
MTRTRYWQPRHDAIAEARPKRGYSASWSVASRHPNVAHARGEPARIFAGRGAPRQIERLDFRLSQYAKFPSESDLVTAKNVQ